MSTSPLSRFNITLLSKKFLTRDILILRFAQPKNFSFTPGQFIQFLVPTEGQTLLRPYSLSSLSTDPFLEFCAKILPQGVASTYFLGLTEGDRATIQGPRGTFVCLPDSSQNYFVATGAGIAPIMAIIRHLLEIEKKQEPLILLFGCRYAEDIFWIDRLDELQKKFPHFAYTLTLSRPSPDWQGVKGRVSEHLNDISLSSEYYLCGSADMVKDTRTLLINKGVPPRNIHFEIF